MTVLRDLDELEAKRCLDTPVLASQGGAEMRRVNLAIVTHNRLASDHLRPLVAALESIESIERLCDDSGELYGETIEATRLCAEALAALGHAITKALEA